MSDEPVDLTNFRELTDGDEEMERELFQEFISSAREAIGTLEQNCQDGENDMWRGAAHALKGTSLSLGAESLSQICKEGQDGHAAKAGEKSRILAEIKSEYERVETFLSPYL
ncbi:MAG: Hpt domain-containing protein [Sneathiellales bacterium]|nr:Hpt domain-containing protein [Sneathiellales bacterium]